MKSILIVIPNVTDGTSFYRAMTPLGRLKEILPDYNYIMTDKVNWATLGLVDLVFLQRPYSDEHLELVEMARKNRRPVWVDYDDNLFKVPSWNPAFSIYGKKNIQENVARIVARADVVSVSTHRLLKDLLPLNRRIKVVPNALDDRRFPLDTQVPPDSRHPLVFWRGSGTHDRDLYEYTKEISQLTHEHPDHTFAFIGSPFWLTLEACRKENTVSSAPIDPVEFHESIAQIKPKIMIVPLRDDAFNRCKSNIAWIEGTYAGAVCVAPAWEEWDLPCILQYKNQEEFKKHVKTAIADPELVTGMAQESREHIARNLTLTVVNPLRAEIIKSLT